MVTLFLVFLWFIHALPSFTLLFVWGMFLLLQIMFAVGIGLFTSVLNVFFRDVAQLTAIFLQIWFWLTPIVYVVNVLPPWAREWVSLNVMAHFTAIYQTLLLSGEPPSVSEGVFLVQITLGTLLLGLLCFRTLRQRIPDEL